MTATEPATTEAQRREARRRYQRRGEIEIDEGAVVVQAEGGVWVAAWCWVADARKEEGA
jgi:hypothetical protein